MSVKNLKIMQSNGKCGDHFCARPRGAVVTKAQDLTSKENLVETIFAQGQEVQL